MRCCFCKEKIEPVGTWTRGNNAQPIKNGRCCNDCNETIVIPMRLMLALKASTKGNDKPNP